MFEHTIRSFEFSQTFAAMMVNDIADERLAEQPRPGMNHAAWLLGHLALAADFIGRDLGAARVAPEGWMELCGPGSTPVADRSRYPSKEELLGAMEQSRLAVPKILEAVDPAIFDEPSGEMFATMGLPTRGDVIAGLLTAHHGFHTGQLSAWRRAMGFAPVFAR